LFCYGPDVTLQFFYSFGPIMMCFLIYPAKHLNPSKLWKLLASNPCLCCFWWIPFECWWGKIWFKNHQQAPPHLVLRSSSSKGMKD
jgi:hypothetical protein